jgi:hypothetical protein
MNARALTLATCAFSVALLARGLGAQDLLPAHGLGGESLAQYRNFALKSGLPAVSALAGTDASAAKTIHERPAVLQELEWRPSRWIAGSSATSTDPVEKIVFSFYNNQLFRVVVDYAQDRTEGMTGADMVDAISDVYGMPVKRLPGVVRAASGIETESGSPTARWGDADHAVVLYRSSSYGETFRLIVTDRALDDLARKAETQAMRLDERDAPRREVARQQKEKDDGRAVAAKARIANKRVFRP